jgi:hypothetical protein
VGAPDTPCEEIEFVADMPLNEQVHAVYDYIFTLEGNPPGTEQKMVVFDLDPEDAGR